MNLAKVLKYTHIQIVKIALFGAILFLPHMASAQTDKEFWFAAPYINDEGRDFDKPVNVRITTLASPATVVISLPADPSFTPITRNVAANSTISVDLTPWIAKLQNTPANTALNKGLLIKSTGDITAYYEVVSSFCNCNPEVFALKGKNALGNEFFISSQYTYDESVTYNATNSFDIVATANNTHVTITPSKNIIGHNANVPFTVILNKGQTYSAVAVSKLAGGHLQGSYITSDNPVAITLKDDLVQVSSCADLVGDQTVPTSVLGTEYVVTKGFLQQPDNIYVLAVENGTSVYEDGYATPLKVLNKGESVTINLSNPSTYIRSDKKIYVYHLTGNGCEVGSAIIPKLNCTGSQSVSIVRSSADLFAVMITTKNGNQNNFTVNGDNTLVRSSDFTPVPGTGGNYVTARIDLSGSVIVGSALNFSNSTGKFSLGFVNGGTNDGARYGFFSDFKSSNVQTSSLEVCQSASVQLNAYGGVIYKWSPATGLSNPNIANPVASPVVTTDYKVTITTADGCIDSAKVHVKVLPVKKVDTTVTICPGGSYKLPSGKVVKTAGIYTDNVSYASGCDSLVTTLHLKVSSNAPVSVTISASANNICAGTPVTFTASPVNAGPAPVYQWKVNGTNAGTNSITFKSNTITNNDKVSCVMMSSSSCSAPAGYTSNIITMAVTASKPVSVTISASKSNICVGALVKFTAAPVNGGTTPVYQWQVNGKNAGTNSTTFSSSTLANNDKVTCILTANVTCAAPAAATSNTITLTVNPYVTPSVSISASANNICPGATVTFTAVPANGGAAPAYQWKVNGINAGSNSAAFTSSTLADNDVISCTLTSNNACLATPTANSNKINISVSAAITPGVSITSSDNNVCAGTPVTFTAKPVNGGSAPAYQWLVNGGNAGTNSNTFTSNTLVNGDIVTCRLTSNVHCAVPLTVVSSGIVMVVNAPAVVNGGGDKIVAKGSGTQLSATASGNITDITWAPATGLSDPQILNPVASPTTTTVYTLTVQTTGGCLAMATVKVTVITELKIPNIFTPNGDGKNDVFKIDGIESFPGTQLLIFNRWGNEVYHADDYKNNWDGGNLAEGTYYYVVNKKESNGEVTPYKGWLYIKRSK